MGKRAFDIVVGTILALLSLPVVLVLALAVGVLYRTWPFFVHERIGRDGQRFKFPKLRSMPAHAPKYATYHNLDLDLPRFARFLRRSKLDELPQLFLVPIGRLSLVGPRPAMPAEYEPVDPAFLARRLSVPPGCTGLWQVGQDTEGLPSESPEYDDFYVANASMRLDLVVLWWTALLMVGVGRFRSLSEIPGWARRREGVVADRVLWGHDSMHSDGPIPLTSPASAASTLSDG